MYYTLDNLTKAVLLFSAIDLLFLYQRISVCYLPVLLIVDF